MTTPSPLPTWLTAATAAHRTASTTASTAHDSTVETSHPSPVHTDPAPGQIRRLDAMDIDAAASRLVLIVATDPASAAAQVVLLSNETEMASDTDAALPRTATGLSFDLLALTDVIGPAWYVQFGPVLSSVDLHLIEIGDLADSGTTAGTPVEGPCDPRWDWKQAEHDALMALVGECARQVIDEEPDTVVDPATLDLGLVSDEQLALMVQAAAPMLARRQACMPARALRNLVDARVSPRSPYWESVRCLVELALRRSDLIVGPTRDALSLASRDSVNQDDLSAVLSATFDRQPASHRSLRLLTLRSLWTGEETNITITSASPTTAPRKASSGVWEVFISGRRHQLLVQPVEGHGSVEQLTCAFKEAAHA